MNLWPVEHFFEHICHHFWAGATGATANPPKSDDKYAQKSVQLSKVTSYKIHTLVSWKCSSIEIGILFQNKFQAIAIF